jgi:hypothetical protein
MKYSTADDLGEVKRGIQLLKKGYQTQKISVSETFQFTDLNRVIDYREFACFSARTASKRGVAPHHPRK